MRRFSYSISLLIICFCAANNALACVNPPGEQGEIIYNTSEDVFQGCTNTQWVPFHIPAFGTGSCTLPGGLRGEILYNTFADQFQGCTDQGWAAFHGDGLPEVDATGPIAFLTDPLPSGDFVSHAASLTPPFTGTDGVLAADHICQDFADDNGLLGTYMAWIASSGGSDDPDTRFTRDTSRYFMPNGVIIANNYTDLVDGELFAPIRVLADGTTFTGSVIFNSVWTNVGTAGVEVGGNNRDCLGWTSGLNADRGWAGNFTNSLTGWTSSARRRCDLSAPIYCFQQDYTPPQNTVPGGCFVPPGEVGEIIYNISENLFQGCTPTGWVVLN